MFHVVCCYLDAQQGNPCKFHNLAMDDRKNANMILFRRKKWLACQITNSHGHLICLTTKRNVRRIKNSNVIQQRRSVSANKQNDTKASEIPADINEQWIFVETIKLSPNGNVTLAWTTNQIRMIKYEYGVCVTDNLKHPVSDWDSYDTKSFAITVDYSAAPLHQMIVSNAILKSKSMFFKVKAIRKQD